MEGSSKNASKRFEKYSKLAGAICDSKFIESEVDNEKNDRKCDYINYRYLDALARILSVSGDCTAVFIRKSVSGGEQHVILSSQRESTYQNLKSRLELYRTRNLENINGWKQVLDDEIKPKKESNDPIEVLNSLRKLENEITTNFMDNKKHVEEKLEMERQKWKSLKIMLNTTLYIAYNSNVDDKKKKNIVKNVLEGINRSVSNSDDRILVKIAFLVNKKFNTLLSQSTVQLRKNPDLERTTTDVYKTDLLNLKKEINSCYVKLEKDEYPEDDIKKIPYESIERILLSNWIKDEPFIKLKGLSLRIFQDAVKLYALSQDKEKWVPLNKYEIVQNPGNLHAEIALVTKIREFERILHEDLPEDNLKSILPYIGISKLCCPLCHCTLDLLGVKHLGTHNILYAGQNIWKLCEILKAEHKNELSKIIKNHLISQIPNFTSNLKSEDVIEFNHKLDPEISDDEIESEIILGEGFNFKTLRQIKNVND